MDFQMNNEYANFEGILEIKTIEENGKTLVMIYENPKGLFSLGKALIKISEENQDELPGLASGDSVHTHIYPRFHLTKSSLEAIIGRLDKKEISLSRCWGQHYSFNK